MTRSIKALITGLAIVGMAQSASAKTPQTSSDVNMFVVRYGDLNLQNEAGATTLLKRLSKAASYVCEVPPPGASNLHHRIEQQACREETLQSAVATVDHPMLTALYQRMRSNSATELAGR